MNKIKFILTTLSLVTVLAVATAAQTDPSFHISRIIPFDKAVPGQILELQVEGLGGAPPVTLLNPEDFRVDVSQDGVTQSARLRLVLPSMTRRRNSDGTFGEMTPFQHVGFIVPKGLHPGKALVLLSYKGKSGNPLELTVIDRPLRPTLGGPGIITMSPASLPTPPAGTRVSDLGWRFERDSKAHLQLKPLPDPDDPGASVIVRFKQGNDVFEAAASVVSQPQRTEKTNKGLAFLPPRDSLEVQIPAGLMLGPAEMEIKLRVGGTESDPVSVKVQITDTTRSAEAPAVNAPRLLNVTPRRVGAGQALILSVDYLRTLNPDPAQTLALIERDSARYFLKPERNTALGRPNQAPDAPVLLIVRPTKELMGPAQIKLLNALKGEQGGTSAPISIEIVDEVLPPEIISVAEATAADLARLREMFEIARAEGRRFNAYQPGARYLMIRGRSFDPNPRFLRITLEQNAQSVTLTAENISSISTDHLLIRLPATAAPGAIKISIANVGFETLSAPAVFDFNLN